MAEIDLDCLKKLTSRKHQMHLLFSHFWALGYANGLVRTRCTLADVVYQPRAHVFKCKTGSVVLQYNLALMAGIRI